MPSCRHTDMDEGVRRVHGGIMADGSHRNTFKQGINSDNSDVQLQMLRTYEGGPNLSNPCAYHGTVTSIALRR